MEDREPEESESTDTGSDQPEIIEISTPQPPELHLEAYVKAKLPARPRWAELRNETLDVLLDMIGSVAQIQGPASKMS